jgi:RNA-binding protein Tab2/Atab2
MGEWVGLFGCDRVPDVVNFKVYAELYALTRTPDMSIWQIDISSRPQQNDHGETLWELVICPDNGAWHRTAICAQKQVNSDWISAQLRLVAVDNLPTLIQVFRPQSWGLIQLAGEQLGIEVVATRRTIALKKLLQLQAQNYNSRTYQPLAIESPPPQPIPDYLIGDKWQFVTLTAGQLVADFADRPIPIVSMPDYLLPPHWGLGANVAIPGVIIYGGRQSMRLARWIAATQPVSLNYLGDDPGGLVLDAGLADRWVILTFNDPEVSQAAKLYAARQRLVHGLHFLVVTPDDSGITNSGIWLFQSSLAISN